MKKEVKKNNTIYLFRSGTPLYFEAVEEEEIEEEESEEEELEARMWAEECERAKTNAFYDANRSLL